VLDTVYVTAQRSDDFLATMGAAIGAKAGDVVCFEHTHVPWHRAVASRRGIASWHRAVGGVHFVNAGSVGRPKDRSARAGYVLLDVGEGEPRVEVVGVACDVGCTACAIVASELADDFAEYAPPDLLHRILAMLRVARQEAPRDPRVVGEPRARQRDGMGAPKQRRTSTTLWMTRRRWSAEPRIGAPLGRTRSIRRSLACGSGHRTRLMRSRSSENYSARRTPGAKCGSS